MEKQILEVAYSDRGAWRELKDRVDEKDFSPYGWAIFKEITKYYEADEAAQAASKEILTARLKRAYPKADVFEGIIGGLSETVSIPNLISEIFAFKRLSLRRRLADKLLDEKQEDIAGIEKLWEHYNDYLVAEEVDGNTPIISSARSIGDVVHGLVNGDNIIKLYPDSINSAVGGGVPMQTHIIVFATPEVGKSAFVINQAVMSARDGHKVLFFDNEDPEDQTWLRIQSRITKMSREQIYNDPEKAQEILNSKDWYRNLHVVSHNPGTIQELEALVDQIQPKLFICNQIRNLYFKGVDGDVAQLTVAGRAMRSLIKRHNLVGISVTQAADSAARKAVLDIGDVYMSNTSLPGDADVMIGIGATPDMLDNGYRMLSLPKNKLTGDHEPRGVAFDKHLSRYRSV